MLKHISVWHIRDRLVRVVDLKITFPSPIRVRIPPMSLDSLILEAIQLAYEMSVVLTQEPSCARNNAQNGISTSKAGKLPYNRVDATEKPTKNSNKIFLSAKVLTTDP